MANGVLTNCTSEEARAGNELKADERCWSDVLKAQGYSLGYIGKWHLGHTPQFLPRTQGFDEYFGILYSNDMRPVQLVEDDRVVEYPVVQATLTKRYTQRALGFVERSCRDNRPFFLYPAHAMPHKPLAASEDFYTAETPDDLYADVIRELDWSVVQVLSRIRQLGIAGDASKSMMLFDIVSNPAEQKDVSGEHPEVVSRLQALFDQAAAEVPAFNRPHQSNGLRRLRGGTLTYEE